MAVDRRTFLYTSAGAVATTRLARAARTDKNSTLRVAVLGLNGRGRTHIKNFEAVDGVDVAVLCDPDRRIMGQRAEAFEKKYGRAVETETDLRKVFDRKDIDIVGIATPNHWHALAAIWACQAGKDVYVEKPGSHNLFEGRKMIEAAQRHQRIVQHGVQLRSSPAIQEGVEHLRKGTIGEVYMARGLVFRWRPSVGHKPAQEETPQYLDWNMWQGPAQQRPFSRQLVHYNWHWHWDYGNGDVGNQGIHETDMCLWGLDVQLPKQIVGMGGKYLWDDDKQTPEVLTTCYSYPEQNKLVQFEVRHWCTNTEEGVTVGNIFYGSEGILVVKGYGTYEIYFGRGREPGPRRSDDGDQVPLHVHNFVEAVRSRRPEILNGPVETVHYSSGLAHLGNIAYRLGRQLTFDPQSERFVGDTEADAMLTRDYREPFVVPQSV